MNNCAVVAPAASQRRRKENMSVLEYRIVQAADGRPLVTLESPLGNGQEIRPDALRALAHHLLAIATEADARHMGRGYRAASGKVDY